MGVLTDLVIADRSDASRVGESLGPSEEFGGLDAKGIDQIKLGTLHAILSNTEFDPDFMMTDETFLYTGSEDGPWVQEVPPDLIRRLDELGQGEIARVAGEWAKTDEFTLKFGGWPPQAVETFLRSLITLAKHSVAQGKSVLMWTCL